MSETALESPAGRVLTNGAFIIDGPGTYVEYRADSIVIGNRPGALLWSLTGFIWCITLSLGWLFWPHSRAIAALPSVVMGLPPILALLNRQRWEITAEALMMRGRALGMRTHKDYPLNADSRVRIAERPTWRQPLPALQVQVLTASGDWIGIAESRDRERLVPLAQGVSNLLELREATLDWECSRGEVKSR